MIVHLPPIDARVLYQWSNFGIGSLTVNDSRGISTRDVRKKAAVIARRIPSKPVGAGGRTLFDALQGRQPVRCLLAPDAWCACVYACLCVCVGVYSRPSDSALFSRRRGIEEKRS